MNIDLNSQHSPASCNLEGPRRYVKYLAWMVGALTFLNALYYILRTANPVIRSDDWYFLDVFVRRVLDGSVGLGDFFVKRHGADHAQPMGKLLLLAQLRYFELDFSVESIVGILSAAICAVLLYRILVRSLQNDRADTRLYIAWAAICAVLFSLNSPGIWTWPLVAMQYLNLIPALLFAWAAWRSWQTGKYALLGIATLVMGVADDDGAIIFVIAVVASMLFAMISNTAPRGRRAWLTIGVVLLCMLIVRLCYSFAPVEGGAPLRPFSSYLGALLDRLHEGAGLSWIVTPLALSVMPRTPLFGWSTASWNFVVAVIVFLLLVAHSLFWWRAFRVRYNLAAFIAVFLMLLSYAWLAGILVYRVSELGNDYLYQERYVFLYQFNLISLLLLWSSGARKGSEGPSTRREWNGYWVPVTGAMILILLQVPLSAHAWDMRKYLVAYYHQMAVQLERLAQNPANTAGCLPELTICTQPLQKREALVQLLELRRLNVFSPRLQRWHPYLPKIQSARQDAAVPSRSSH